MTIKLCVIMDPIEAIHPKKDTTLALLLEAQSRDMKCIILLHDQIFMEDHQNLWLNHPDSGQ